MIEESSFRGRMEPRNGNDDYPSTDFESHFGFVKMMTIVYILGPTTSLTIAMAAPVAAFPGRIQHREAAMARNIRTQEVDDDDYDEIKVGPPRAKARMIDRLQCCKLPVFFSLIGYFVLSALIERVSKRHSPWTSLPNTWQDVAFSALSVLLIVLGPLAFLSQILGFSFDAAKNQLSYPLYVFRRSVRLSEINDANCQTITKPAFHITNTIIGMISVGQVKGLGNTKRYIVNMSGEFGA